MAPMEQPAPKYKTGISPSGFNIGSKRRGNVSVPCSINNSKVKKTAATVFITSVISRLLKCFLWLLTSTPCPAPQEVLPSRHKIPSRLCPASTCSEQTVITTTPATDKRAIIFCVHFICSFRKIAPMIIAITGIRDTITPACDEGIIVKPFVSNVYDRSGYTTDIPNKRYHGFPFKSIRIT